MLTLANLQQRIERLESEEYGQQDDQLSTWIQLIKWAAMPPEMRQPDEFGRCKWQPEEFSKVYHGWWYWVFLPTLPGNEASMFWYADKVCSCFYCWIEAALEENTPAKLCNVSAMSECLAWVSHTLITEDWQWYDNAKRQQIQFYNDRIQHQSDFTNGKLTETGAEWLRQNGKDFLQMNAKRLGVDVETAIKKALATARPANPVASDPAIVAHRLEVLTTPPPPIVQPEPMPNSGPVTLRYSGSMRGFTILTVDGFKSIEPGETVTLPAHVAENLGGYPAGWWVRI